MFFALLSGFKLTGVLYTPVSWETVVAHYCLRVLQGQTMRFTISVTVLFAVTMSSSFAQTKYLDQGWDDEMRQEFYFTAQGSHLIPYKWFLALEQAENDRLFRDEANMRSYGILPSPPTKRNPAGLPVGFVRDGVDPVSSEIAGLSNAGKRVLSNATKYKIKRAFFGPQADEKLYPKEQKAWFGFTCAACHTHEIEYNGQTVRIDGGSTQSDLESFLRDLGLALTATHEDPEKLQRFAIAVGRNKSSLATFDDEVKQIADAVNRLVLRNKAKHPYGYARLDAFGAILNAVCDTALNEPANRRESNAPVSYPSLWNVPFMGYVQWGATAPWAEPRNVGEVLGVFGYYSLDPGPRQFESTVRLKNLVKLEHEILTKLRAPDWPEDVFGKLDTARVSAGQKLFAQNCQACHAVRNEDGQFTLNDADRIPVTAGIVGTDMQFLENLSPTHMAKTGELSEMFGGAAETPRVALLSKVVEAIMVRSAKAERVDLGALRPKNQDPAGTGFIERPIEGIWANAPYFHNGSVPNLYETLLPSSKRSSSFWVGTRKFDPVKVGFVTTETGTGSEFKTTDSDGNPIPGNSNKGHEGHGDSPNHGFTQTFENGEWRDFTEDEIYSLIEYMKSVSAVPSRTEGSVQLEQIPEGEEDRISNIVDLTRKQMMKRYADKKVLRGVHPKDHGCVTAKFEVSADLPAEYSVGVFKPGASYDAYIRFSNAAVRVNPDSGRDQSGNPSHGSRGMAVKLLGVDGESLLPLNDEHTQDFLMVNQPSFAFANVEDYEVLSQVLLDNDDDPTKFIVGQLTNGSPEAKQRAQRTAQIAGRIAAAKVDGDKGAFEQPPASPVDNAYFGAAPFLFGDGRVMKFRASPVSRSLDKPNVDDPNYLRTALIKRLATQDVVFEFGLQVRTAEQLDLPVDIENAQTVWPDEFVTVAKITIPKQEFDSLEQREECENLFFTPWQGVAAHRPLGGINRLRKAVYLESFAFRHGSSRPSGN